MMIKWGAVLAAMAALALGGAGMSSVGALRAAEAAPLRIYTQWHGQELRLDGERGGGD
jgi:hypothetical protein